MSLRFTKLTSPITILACGAAGLQAGLPALADTFNFTVNQPASAVSYTVDASSPLTGTFRGNQTATPATRTRTPPQSFFSCGIAAGQNDPVPYRGTGRFTGSGSNIRPSGTFEFGIDAGAGISSVTGLSLNLLGGGTAPITALIDDFTASAFCAVNPSCQVPISLTIDLPLGEATVTTLTATQTPGTAAGTLTPAGVDTWTFSIPGTVTATSTVLFGGAPIPVDPIDVPVVFAGTIVRPGGGSTATITASVQINLNPPPTTTPTLLPESPITLAGAPVCNGLNLLLASTVTSTTFTLTSNTSVVADGVRAPCPADVNGSGTVDADDIFAFLNLWFGAIGPCPATPPPTPCPADVNGSGTVDADDIFAFLVLWFAGIGACP